jgi:hypothetical protein
MPFEDIYAYSIKGRQMTDAEITCRFLLDRLSRKCREQGIEGVNCNSLFYIDGGNYLRIYADDQPHSPFKTASQNTANLFDIYYQIATEQNISVRIYKHCRGFGSGYD